MDIINSVINILHNKWLWIVLLLMYFMAYGFLRTVFRKIPILSNKKYLFVVILIGVAFTWGLFASFGFSSTGSFASAAAVNIIDVQTTTAATGNCTESVSTTIGRTTDVRCTDGQVDETSGVHELNATVITLTRSGDLTKAAGLPLACIVPSDYVNQDGVTAQTTPLHLIERDSLGAIECYLQNAAAATESSQKGLTTAVFAEGAGTATFGVLFEVEEDGHDGMLQYNSLPVRIVNSETGETLWTYNVFRM